MKYLKNLLVYPYTEVSVSFGGDFAFYATAVGNHSLFPQQDKKRMHNMHPWGYCFKAGLIWSVNIWIVVSPESAICTHTHGHAFPLVIISCSIFNYIKAVLPCAGSRLCAAPTAADCPFALIAWWYLPHCLYWNCLSQPKRWQHPHILFVQR